METRLLVAYGLIGLMVVAIFAALLIARARSRRKPGTLRDELGPNQSRRK